MGGAAMPKLETIKTLERLEREMSRAGRKEEEAALREARGILARSEPGLVTTGQAAMLLNVSIPTIKRMVERGTLAGAPVGGRWRVSRESVEALLQLRQTLLEFDREGHPSPEEIQTLIRQARRSGRGKPSRANP